MTTTTTPSTAPRGQDGRRRASYRTQRIRLGGQAVVSLETIAEPDHADGGGSLLVDWPNILKLAGFDDSEAALLVAGVEGVPRTRLAEHLGWEDCKTETVRKRARRKLNKLQVQFGLPTVLKVDGSRTAQLLRFPQGGLVWEHRMSPTATV